MFLNNLEKISNKIIDEKGAQVFKSTLNANLDLFAVNLKYLTKKEIFVYFYNALQENKETLMANILNIIDIRDGKGFRQVGQELLKLSIKEKLIDYAQAYTILSKYGRLDTFFKMLDNADDVAVKILINNIWTNDMPNNFLIAKWLPSINTSNVEVVKRAKRFASLLGISKKEYRTKLSKIRKQSNLLEVNMTTKNWDKIEIDKLPSKALFLNKDTLKKRLPEQFVKAEKGEIKINVGALWPYEIIKKYYKDLDYDNEIDTNEFKMFWDNMKKPEMPEGLRIFPICDLSGSMNYNNGIPMYNSLALGLMFAQSNKGVFKNKLIQFNGEFDLIHLPSDSGEALIKLSKYDAIGTTNLDKVMKGILEATHGDEEEIPTHLLIISDLNFNNAVSGGNNIKYWKEIYNEKGLTLPKIIFWNVANNTKFPVENDEEDIAIISGFSTAILNNLFTPEVLTPFSAMINELQKYKEFIKKELTL